MREDVGLSADARVRRIRYALDHSRSLIGGLWRKLKEREHARVARVAEDSTNCRAK